MFIAYDDIYRYQNSLSIYKDITVLDAEVIFYASNDDEEKRVNWQYFILL